MASAFFTQMTLRKLFFIPAGQPYHKDIGHSTPPAERYEMIRLAISGYDHYYLSDCELLRYGDTYTVDTLQFFSGRLKEKEELWWLLGSDSLVHLHQWHRYEEIFELANIAVVLRSGFQISDLAKPIYRLIETGIRIAKDDACRVGKVHFLDMPVYNVSSSQVRQVIAGDGDLTPLLPEPVIQYITEHKLYLRNSMDQLDTFTRIVVQALEDVKGKDITVLDTEQLTAVFQKLIVATGESNRQVKSLARNVAEELKKAGCEIIGVEGMESGDWVLVDTGDILVHVMLPAVRDYYDIEALWGGEKPSSLAFSDKKWNPIEGG